MNRRSGIGAKIWKSAWTTSRGAGANLHQPAKIFPIRCCWRAFHHGIDYVEQRDFDLRRIEPPDNAIYRKLWRGKPRARACRRKDKFPVDASEPPPF